MKSTTQDVDAWFKLVDKMNELLVENMKKPPYRVVEFKQGYSLLTSESRQLFREQLAEELYYLNQVPSLDTRNLIMMDNLACQFGEVIRNYGSRPLVVSTYQRMIGEYVGANGLETDEDIEYIAKRFQAMLGNNDQQTRAIDLALAAALFGIGWAIGTCAGHVYVYLTEDDDDRAPSNQSRALRHAERSPNNVDTVTIVQIAKRALALPEYQSFIYNYQPVFEHSLTEDLAAAKIFEELLKYPDQNPSKGDAAQRIAPAVVYVGAILVGALIGFIDSCASGKTDKKDKK